MARDDDLLLPDPVGGPVAMGHHDAVRLILRTWSGLVLGTLASTARGTCGPVTMTQADIDLLVTDLGGEVEVEALAAGWVSLTCDIDSYVVQLLISVQG